MTAPDRLYIPLTAFENYSEKYSKLEFEGAYVGDESETYLRESALHETHIRRDDPALRRVEDALEHALYLLPRNCNQRVSMEAALAAMQELIGGKDG